MEVVLTARNNQQLATLLLGPFTDELGRNARDHMLQALPQSLTTAMRTAKQAICYVLWKANQIAPAEDSISDDHEIRIDQIDPIGRKTSLMSWKD